MEQGGLKVLMISSDRNILAPDSAVQARMKEYGGLVNELHIVLMSDTAHKLTTTQLRSNVWVYPTNVTNRWFRTRKAATIGKHIVADKGFVRGKSLITVQDPFECGLAGLKIKERWRLPLEVQLHTDPFSPYFTGFVNTLRKRIARKVLRQADGLRVVLGTLGRLIASEYGIAADRVTVLPIHVDQEKFIDPSITFDLHTRYGWKFVCLTVSRLAAEKQIDLAIKALGLVLAEDPNVGLVIIGSGPEEEQLKALVKKLGLEQNVVFAGWQGETNLYYATANIFLQTSAFEGYGMSLVEAGLAKVPVITTKVGVANELVDGEDAYICEPTPEAFAFAISDLAESETKRMRLKEHLFTTLKDRLVSRQEYLRAIQKAWQKTALRIQA